MDITPQLEFRFASSLEPVLDMLSHKKLTLSPLEWRLFVIRTKECIILHPSQFFESSLAEDDLVDIYVEKTFQKILTEETLALK